MGRRPDTGKVGQDRKERRQLELNLRKALSVVSTDDLDLLRHMLLQIAEISPEWRNASIEQLYAQAKRERFASEGDWQAADCP
jgi:hypothetical protein